MRRKETRAINLSWSIPLLAVLFVAGMLLSWTAGKRQIRPDTTPRKEGDETT